MPKFSIIIPTYNESQNLPLLLSDLSNINSKDEIIIIDANSKDKTRDIAMIYGAKVFKSKEKGRGSQLKYGAEKAKGNWFIFIHADSRLTQDWYKKVKSFIKGNEDSIFYFLFKINSKKLIYRLLENLVNFRSYFFKEPYGDQGLVINKETYFKNKGYKNIPLMEDIDFIKRLTINHNLKRLNLPIYTSCRKWEKTNIINQAIKNWNFRKRWSKGESTKSLHTDYYKN